MFWSPGFEGIACISGVSSFDCTPYGEQGSGWPNQRRLTGVLMDYQYLMRLISLYLHTAIVSLCLL